MQRQFLHDLDRMIFQKWSVSTYGCMLWLSSFLCNHVQSQQENGKIFLWFLQGQSLTERAKSLSRKVKGRCGGKIHGWQRPYYGLTHLTHSHLTSDSCWEKRTVEAPNPLSWSWCSNISHTLIDAWDFQRKTGLELFICTKQETTASDIIQNPG